MGGLQWYDWIQPSNPFASIFFGILFSIVLAIIAWFDTKEIKKSMYFFLIAGILVMIFVGILYVLGYYA